MHELPTVGQIDHHRPKVYQPLAKSLIGTRSRFDPLEFDSGPLGSVAHDFHAETGKAARGANLDGGLFSKPMRRGRVGTDGTERGSAKARGVPLSLPAPPIAMARVHRPEVRGQFMFGVAMIQRLWPDYT